MDLSEVFNLLFSKGINVKKNVRVRGLSGVHHEFDAMVDEKVGIIVTGGGISPEDSLRIVLKKMDTGLKIIVLSPNPLPESQRYILEEMDVQVVEGSDQERVVETIMFILRQLDQGR
ncbi:MAG: hypothetical protein DSO07_06505 [Thermoproteota archaeon]|jgi:hypothetical protein|uniref:Uncharacterized protein n=1 Tax=Candidatus Methanodesulfokora washburnensis TaxID=2478471 RepID=A0A520KNH9_9CREN|nr:MAG: hypothetical protein EF810_01790 [Candidatus Methanodesulfokores washburnensis]TDA41080.1 MAG: hypothetical protein DSO07_06505 [Candidatus Korarchaeota archaeon]